MHRLILFNRVHWNEKFASWHRPPSDSEEDRIKRAARMIKAAIHADNRLSGHNIEVIPQGSYHNNTNVRLNSDMDLCVRYNGHCMYYIAPGANVTAADLQLTPLPPGTVEATARELKQVLHSVLRGIGQVEWGNKALKMAAVEGSRIDADVVPAVGYVFARRTTSLGPTSPVIGTALLTDDGLWVLNFPAQHHDRGKEKNERTGPRYKRTVRILKRLKEELQLVVAPPSFLVECLVYNCPNSFFAGDDWHLTVSSVLGWIHDRTADDFKAAWLVEANGIKTLFAPGQPWTREQAHYFTTCALRHIA